MITPQSMENDVFKVTGKYNNTIKLTEADRKAGVKVYCQEDYAQGLYDAMTKYDQSASQATKDLSKDRIYKVKAKTISFSDKMIYAEEVGSTSTISIPFKEYTGSLDELAKGETSDFYVMVYKASLHGEYFGSERKAASITYKYDLFDHLKENTWFDVTITRLIKGGYLAVYRKEVECFIPGSHAAANVVHNFNDMLGKTLTVMVDNYDQSNDLFILSYKKYVAESMSTMIENLNFGTEYQGVLTNKPYDFGVFVEIDGYYTGLVHKSEFEDYEKVKRTLKTGDTLPVFVKDVTSKGSQFRIVLTLGADNVNSEKAAWQKLKERTENRSFMYSVNNKNSSISIEVDGESFEVSLKKKDLEKNLNQFPFVKVSKVNPIQKSVKFEFVEDEII
jgi:predicted RNA-binding protein with RPS1 domain